MGLIEIEADILTMLSGARLLLYSGNSRDCGILIVLIHSFNKHVLSNGTALGVKYAVTTWFFSVRASSKDLG